MVKKNKFIGVVVECMPSTSIRYTAVEALQTLDKQKLLAPQESGNKSAKKFRNIDAATTSVMD